MELVGGLVSLVVLTSIAFQQHKWSEEQSGLPNAAALKKNVPEWRPEEGEAWRTKRSIKLQKLKVTAA